jgi:hypothetical protein
MEPKYLILKKKNVISYRHISTLNLLLNHELDRASDGN